MTTFLLVRHGSTDALGKWLAGRQAGVLLNEQGQIEAGLLPARLAAVPIAAIYSSPMERAQQTAEPLSRNRKLDIHVNDQFNEIDFGEWTSKSFEELDRVPGWRDFNQFRSSVRLPGGESMLQ